MQLKHTTLAWADPEDIHPNAEQSVLSQHKDRLRIAWEMWQSTSSVVDERSKRAGQVFFSKRSSKYKALSCLSFCVWSFPVTSQSGQIYLNLRTAIYSMGRAGDVKAQWKGSGSRNWIFCMNQFSLDEALYHMSVEIDGWAAEQPSLCT